MKASELLMTKRETFMEASELIMTKGETFMKALELVMEDGDLIMANSVTVMKAGDAYKIDPVAEKTDCEGVMEVSDGHLIAADTVMEDDDTHILEGNGRLLKSVAGILVNNLEEDNDLVG
ncbi:MAG: hypothetical protein JEZ14_08920 [Marinilabiliaceae bacterium]|nr:hypothetical protein [Marinilabiliaceae bacterium]